MKNWQWIFTLLLALACIASAQMYTTSGDCVALKCVLCDRELVEWTDGSITITNGDYVWPGGHICVGDAPQTIGRKLQVCEKCQARFVLKLDKAIEKWVDETRASLITERQEVARDQFARSLKELEAEQELLKARLSELKKLKAKLEEVPHD